MFEAVKRTECACGKEHIFDSEVVMGEGALARLPELLKKRNIKSAFIIADKNTYAVAGERAESLIAEHGIEVKKYVFDKDELEPNEENVGLAVMYFDPSCDAVIGVGSGVINDISKIVANVSDKPYIIVGTAPSMDGYASSSSSMTREGLKISLNSKCPEVIIGDTEILCKAPLKMMRSGLGDMLAKYISICEWRISGLINEEYYCEEIAGLVRASLKKCVDNADGLLKRDKTAVEAVFEGLILSGAAMNLAGVSRPASGVEHYLSHVWDMRAISFSTPFDFHGIQCALGTLISLGIYEKIKSVIPDREKALRYAESFDFSEWSERLRGFVGKGAEAMIALEAKEGKYDVIKHRARLERIIEKWDDILQIIDEELPTLDEALMLFDKVGLPKTMEDIGLEESILPMTFKASKDMRDKYVLPRLCWDLGIIDELF